MKLTALLIVLPLVASTMPLLAQTTTGQTATQSERRVCRSFHRSGSNIRVRRVCLTEAQWAERERLDRERVQELMNRPQLSCSPGQASCQ